MESSRRQQAQADLGMDFAKEDQKRKAALAKEQARADKKGSSVKCVDACRVERIALT